MVNLKICFFNDADPFNDVGTFNLGPEGLLFGVKKTPSSPRVRDMGSGPVDATS